MNEPAKKEDPKPRPTRVAVLHVGPKDEPAASVPADAHLGFNLPVEDFEKAASELKEIGADVVVLRFDCVAATHESLKPFLDMLEKSYFLRFRTVAWVGENLNEANICVFAIPEIYMTTKGGMLSSICRWPIAPSPKGQLEERLALGERACAMGKHPWCVLRAMLIEKELSMSVVGGELRFFDDVSGERVLSKAGAGMSLRTEEAVACGVVRGAADDRTALVKAMGISNVEWVGEAVDERVQKRWHEAQTDMEKIQTCVLQAVMSFETLQYGAKGDRREQETAKRDAAWSEVVRIRKKWPELAASWGRWLGALISKGSATTWAELAKLVGMEERQVVPAGR